MLTVRALDESGAWSLDQSFHFYKPFAAYTNPVDSIEEINYAEYFIDNDPGYGKATSLAVTSSKQLSNVIINLDTAGISTGIHYLTLRVKEKRQMELKPITNLFQASFHFFAKCFACR